MKSILDPSFKYTKACETDLRKTFNRIRREQKAAAAKQPPPPNVRPITTMREKKS